MRHATIVARQALDNILCAINLILWIAIVGLFLWVMLENKFRSATAVRPQMLRRFAVLLFYLATALKLWPKRKRLGPSADFSRSTWD